MVKFSFQGGRGEDHGDASLPVAAGKRVAGGFYVRAAIPSHSG